MYLQFPESPNRDLVSDCPRDLDVFVVLFQAVAGVVGVLLPFAVVKVVLFHRHLVATVAAVVDAAVWLLQAIFVVLGFLGPFAVVNFG